MVVVLLGGTGEEDVAELKAMAVQHHRKDQFEGWRG
jgi:hypothetical protein